MDVIHVITPRICTMCKREWAVYAEGGVASQAFCRQCWETLGDFLVIRIEQGRIEHRMHVGVRERDCHWCQP